MPKCGKAVQAIAVIHDRAATQKILKHLRAGSSAHSPAVISHAVASRPWQRIIGHQFDAAVAPADGFGLTVTYLLALGLGSSLSAMPLVRGHQRAPTRLVVELSLN
jgi:hypothetical protein